MNVITRAKCAFALAVAGVFGVAHAGVQITGTRVIYPADQREVSVNVVNNDKSPRLLQAWVDSGKEGGAVKPRKDYLDQL